MRRITIAFVIVSLMTAGLTAPTWAKCAPPRTNDFVTHRWAGWENAANSSIAGVQSKIFNYDPYVKPNTDFAMAWVMLTNPSRTSYAQVGWIEHPYDARYTFFEYTYGIFNLWARAESAALPEGTSSVYRVDYEFDGSNHWYHFWAGGQDLFRRNSNFDAAIGQIYGETLSAATQMPGATQVPEVFDNAWRKVNGVWYSFDGTMVRSGPSATTYFGATKVYSTKATVWDKACTT